MADFDLNNVKKAHFVGIGGIGMSGLARLLMHRGIRVSGSDRELTDITKALEAEGAQVLSGHSADNIPKSTDAVIYSPAVPEDNPERSQAREQKISEYSYPEMLGVISEHPFTIAVAGTHGKTTTTAMIAHILKDTKINPTVIVGSLLTDSKSNFVAGGDDYFVVEACEYRRSFIHIHPNILVITNIEADHLDYYKDLDDVIHAFNELVRKVPEEGFIVCDIEDENVQQALVGVSAGVVNYTLYIDDVELSIAGEHNKQNAAAAVAVADVLDISDTNLESFSGTWRRFEKRGTLTTGAELYDDYAHHPTEISATLKAFKEKYPDKNIVVIFQPHLHSRTEHFFNDFVLSLSTADRIITAPIYEARIENRSEMSSNELAEALSKVHSNVTHYDSFDDIVDEINKSTDEDDVVITMGAGDIVQVAEKLVQ